EVIWGNRLKAGDYKYIRGFPHFVADGGDERVGRWLDERIDLAGINAEIWKDAAPAHLVDVAVFCDSDDTHTASISYFAYVRFERRGRRLPFRAPPAPRARANERNRPPQLKPMAPCRREARPPTDLHAP